MLVSSNVTVIQPAHSAMMYVALNLHSTFHGSANVSDIDLRSKVLKRMHIKHVTLCPQRSGVSLESSANDIHVAYPTSPTFSALESCLSGHREKFQQDLTHHLLLGGYTDLKRTSGEVVVGEQSLNIHISFGYGRIQKHTNPHTWYIGEAKMPTLSVDAFK